MRYLKGSIVLNETKDYPLLRRLPHGTFEIVLAKRMMEIGDQLLITT